MKTLIIAFRSIKLRKVTFAVIFVQLSICISVIICTVCAVISQFNILASANNAYENYLRLSTDMIYYDNYRREYESEVDFFLMLQKFMEENNLSEISNEQYRKILAEYTEMQDKEFDEKHYPGKYQFIDLYNEVSELGIVADTISNYSTWIKFNNDTGDMNNIVPVTMMDKKLYEGLRLYTKHGLNLNDYKNPDTPNYYYAIMYPCISSGDKENDIYYKSDLPYGIGTVIVDDNVYNLKTHSYETFYYEIIDEFAEPSYEIPYLEYSGESKYYTYIEKAFLSGQTPENNGTLIVLKPDDFDMAAYYPNFNESLTMMKLKSNITEEQYSKFLDTTIKCGFNTVFLNDAKENTVSEIWQYVRENSLVLIMSVLVVVFSIISISVLLGNRIKHEYAVYRLCGAGKISIMKISAVKWGIIFIPALFAGAVISWIYLSYDALLMRFIPVSTAFSSTVIILVFILSVILSYKAVNAEKFINDISEENND